MIRALSLAVFLNLALLPCALALEVLEDRHDCCPPEINLEVFECCEIDDASLDSRGGVLKTDDTGDVEPATAPALAGLQFAAARTSVDTTGPPDPPPRAVALHVLNCVYLN